MLHPCNISLVASHRSCVPNVGKLLYGKRKNAIHGTSKAKPSVVGMLLQVPLAELRQAARRAVGLRELDRANLSELLKKNRAFNRLDRSELVVEVADEARLALTSSHYCTLMAHANDNKNWEAALRYWGRACREKKVNEKLHGALVAAHRSSSRWKDAVRHFGAMLNDKIIPDPYTLHTVMNACRRANACDVALSTFSKAVHSGSSPNSAVYLELLRCMHQSRLPHRWKMSLAVLQSLEGKVDLTAGLYNATIATMGGALWMKGVELFQSMKAKNVQLSKETLATLVALNPGNIPHMVQCIAEAHTLGMPVTDDMYRALLTTLVQLQLDHEAVRFAEREYKRCTEDPGNPVNSSLSLSLAIIDTLLAHSRPQEALLFFAVFESRLGNILGSATRGLGSIGLRSQRWIVQGRVAVVDHNVLLDPRFESLLSHYDSILVPFSSVRLLVRRVREVAGTVKGRYTKQMLKRLQDLVTVHTALRVLPLANQLNAHTYIVDGPITNESVKLLRETFVGEGEGGETRNLTVPLVIRKGNVFPPLIEAGDASTVTQGGERKLENWAVIEKRGDSLPVGMSSSRAVLKRPDRMSSPERVLAVAAMLKSLNPDASVHVLSPNSVQLFVVESWNKLRPSTGITAVRYPEEISLKAPAAQERQQWEDRSSFSQEGNFSKTQVRSSGTELYSDTTRNLFLPS